MNKSEKINNLNGKIFSNEKLFLDFLMKLWYDKSKLYKKAWYIRYWLTNIVWMYEEDGSIKFYLGIVDQNRIFKNISDKILDILLQKPTIPKETTETNLEKKIYFSNYIKWKLQYNADRDIYFIEWYTWDEERKELKIEFKLEEIDYIQRYNNSPKRNTDEDQEYYEYCIKILKELIDSKSILLIRENIIDSKKTINIEIQFDLRK